MVMQQSVAYPSVEPNSAAKRNKLQAGVRAYRTEVLP